MASNPIAEARRRMGISQEELGAAVGVSRRTVSYWETRRKLPDPDRIESLRRTLGLSDTDVWRIAHRASEKVKPQYRKRGRIW